MMSVSTHPFIATPRIACQSLPCLPLLPASRPLRCVARIKSWLLFVCLFANRACCWFVAGSGHCSFLASASCLPLAAFCLAATAGAVSPLSLWTGRSAEAIRQLSSGKGGHAERHEHATEAAQFKWLAMKCSCPGDPVARTDLAQRPTSAGHSCCDVCSDAAVASAACKCCG